MDGKRLLREAWGLSRRLTMLNSPPDIDDGTAPEAALKGKSVVPALGEEVGDSSAGQACSAFDDSLSPEPGAASGSTGLVRWFFLGLGLIFSGLGTLGAFLPILPTTPFLLLAAPCFARSSPSFHKRLLNNRAFGPYIQQWQKDHTIPSSAKRKAYGLVVLSFSLSIAMASTLGLRLLLASLAVILLVFLGSRPTTR